MWNISGVLLRDFDRTIEDSPHRCEIMSHLTTDDQNVNRVRVCHELLDRSDEDENLLSRIITGDESWVYGYDIETTVQSSQWVGQTSARPKKFI